jgi:parvulin-like peptidyl-prolyl isomerase
MARNHMTADFFGNLAEEYSVEPSSRALRGDIPPIQKFGGQPVLEKEAFALQPGELSGVIQAGDKYVILFCQGFTEPTKITFEEVRDQIFEDIYEKKLRLVMAKEFTSLQEGAQIDNFLANTSQSPYKGKSANDWAPGQSISQPKTARKNASEELPGTLRR